MKKLTALIISVALFATVSHAETTKPEKMTDTKVACIGVYDSRAIAVAFVGSKVYKSTVGKEMNKKMAAYNKAKAEGNKEKVKEFEKWGKARQALLHKQGFSTAPVDNILKHIANKLPEIKRQVKIDILVSKWDTQALAKHKSAEQVDVTMLLIDAFKPNEKQKKSAIEIQKHKPVSLEEMESHKH
jgi:hypothetical protein